jgi:hypothetical protein
MFVNIAEGYYMNRSGLFAALVIGAMLSACATSGTQVVTTADSSYKDTARSQQWWCSNFSSSCACSIDGQKTTCSLVYACLNSGNCKAAAQ